MRYDNFYSFPVSLTKTTVQNEFIFQKLMIYYEKKRNGELSDSESDDGETEVNDKQMAKT